MLEILGWISLVVVVVVGGALKNLEYIARAPSNIARKNPPSYVTWLSEKYRTSRAPPVTSDVGKYLPCIWTSRVAIF